VGEVFGVGVVVGGVGLAVVVVVVVEEVEVEVVEVVVVGAGEAAACAGTITDFTTGFTQRSGNTSALAALPPSAVCKIRRRSVVIVKSPLRRKKSTHFAGRKQPGKGERGCAVIGTDIRGAASAGCCAPAAEPLVALQRRSISGGGQTNARNAWRR
jgi:hypothetical protein